MSGDKFTDYLFPFKQLILEEKRIQFKPNKLEKGE